jgi:hypothetical protein
MKMIEDLGFSYPTKTSKVKTHYGLFECPKCKTTFKTKICDAKHNRVNGCKSCGRKTHGESGAKSSLYGRWLVMKDRCNNHNHKNYARYGGRGITVCKEFNESYEAYREYVTSLPDYNLSLSIDRIDNNKGYERGNLRWASKSTQSRNTACLYNHNTTGYRGVHQYYGIFKARISVDGKRIHIGTFSTSIEAGLAYNEYIKNNNLEHTINKVLE